MKRSQTQFRRGGNQLPLLHPRQLLPLLRPTKEFIDILRIPINDIELFPHDLGCVSVSQIGDEEIERAVVFGEGGEVIVAEKDAERVLGEVGVQLFEAVVGELMAGGGEEVVEDLGAGVELGRPKAPRWSQVGPCLRPLEAGPI